MDARPATADDVAAIAELERRWEMQWFGAPELSLAEVQEFYDRAELTRVVLDGSRIVAAVLVWQVNAFLAIDPAAALAPVLADLLPWCATRPGLELEALSVDTALRAGLIEGGWQHVNSSFELIRAVTPDFEIAQPVWPEGIDVRDMRLGDAAAMHRLIYVDAGWAEIPGHPERTFDDWRRVLLTEHEVPEHQVLAWRGDRLVGVAIGRLFDDNTGWVAQLAVTKTERGHGLGRALLLEALHRRRAAGATSVGLGVQVENRTALGLYLDVGLEIDREWMKFQLP